MVIKDENSLLKILGPSKKWSGIKKIYVNIYSQFKKVTLQATGLDIASKFFVYVEWM